MEEILLKVEGMHCEGCENRIKNIVGDIEGVKEVLASHKDGTVKVVAEGNTSLEAIKEAIEDLGFEVKEG